MNTMLAVVGFGLIFVLVFVLLKGYVAPPVAFVSLPFIAALICGFSLNDIAGFLKGGMSSIMNTTILFVFSISFFTLMGERGLFDPAINALTRRVGNNVTLVLFAVAAASVIGHLDGSGSTTYLIVIPAFLPLCKKLKIRPEAIFATMTFILGFMNLIPWGGPTARAASVVGMETNEYFQVMLPRMAIMVVIAIVFIYIIARTEKKHGAGVLDVSDTIVASAVEERQKLDGKYFVNLFIRNRASFIFYIYGFICHCTGCKLSQCKRADKKNQGIWYQLSFYDCNITFCRRFSWGFKQQRNDG